MHKFLYRVSSFLGISSFLLLSATSSYANSGPVGLNGIRTEPGPGIGQITLTWYRYSPIVDNYNIVYGTSSEIISTELLTLVITLLKPLVVLFQVENIISSFMHQAKDNPYLLSLQKYLR